MYMICASARELLEWCDVPRTKEDYMAGYQRVLTDSRVEEIGAYLSQSPDNILPNVGARFSSNIVSGVPGGRTARLIPQHINSTAISA